MLLMEAAPKEVVNEKMTDNVKAYIETILSGKTEKPEITDNGFGVILKFMQNQINQCLKQRDVEMNLLISSRGVSGLFKKVGN